MFFYKIISVVFHPILFPLFGTLYFFSVKTHTIPREIQNKLIALVFISTYILPIILLFILKKIKKIDSYELKSISQRRIPLFFMIVLFYILGNSILKIPAFIELGILFIGSSLAITVAYFLFIRKIKTSIHMIGGGSAVGFLLFFSYEHTMNMLIALAVAFIISGLIAQSRLYLKAHNHKEIIYGFCFGFLSQLIVYNIYL